MSQALVATQGGAQGKLMQEAALRADSLKMQVAIVREAMSAVMKKNHHYGKIPGCGDKPTLLKPGAEVLALAFQFASNYEISTTEMGEGHREYFITCNLTHRPSGGHVGQGIGSCSTKESKFMRRGQDPANMYNTCLKMAKKRAFVDAILTNTAASDSFTQDIEDAPEQYGGTPGPVRINLESVRATFNKCTTPEQLLKAADDLCLAKDHPDRPAVVAMYKEFEAFIQEAAKQEGF